MFTSVMKSFFSLPLVICSNFKINAMYISIVWNKIYPCVGVFFLVFCAISCLLLLTSLDNAQIVRQSCSTITKPSWMADQKNTSLNGHITRVTILPFSWTFCKCHHFCFCPGLCVIFFVFFFLWTESPIKSLTKKKSGKIQGVGGLTVWI